MKAEELKPHLGKHVFLVAPEGRSIACDVLKVYEDRVCVMEVNCDHWPFSYAELRLDEVSFLIAADEVYEQMEREHMAADPGEFKIVGRPEYGGDTFPLGAPDLFGELRAWLNDEDGLGRPLTAKKRKKLRKRAERNLDLLGLLPVEPITEHVA